MFKAITISITYGHILYNSLKSFCDSSWCYKTNSISNKATCTLPPIPPCNLENLINCMRNQIKPFCEEDTIKHSIPRITFHAFNEWTIFKP